MQVALDSIIINKRVRKELNDLESLKESIKRYGLLNPITINEKNELIAGNRRLEAVRQLGWTTIQANIIDTKDKITLLEMELEENTQRSDFTQEDLLDGFKQLEKLRNPGFFQRIWNAIVGFFKRLFRIKD